jgi:hypothetical protein
VGRRPVGLRISGASLRQGSFSGPELAERSDAVFSSPQSRRLWAAAPGSRSTAGGAAAFVAACRPGLSGACSAVVSGGLRAFRGGYPRVEDLTSRAARWCGMRFGLGRRLPQIYKPAISEALKLKPFLPADSCSF